MSDENNSTGDSHWEPNVDNSYDIQSPESEGDIEQSDTCSEPYSLNSVDLQELPVNWTSSPDPSSFEGYDECGSDFEYQSATNGESPETVETADDIVDGAADDAIDNPTEDEVNAALAELGAVQTTARANDSRLDLRPVPASIDLTRHRRGHRGVRCFTIRIRCSQQAGGAATGGAATEGRRRASGRSGGAASADRNRPVRLCGGQPSRPRYVPLGPDPDYGGIAFILNDTDSEEEPPLKELEMVPRRGNSVSDLSQCSSDEENTEQENGRPKRQ